MTSEGSKEIPSLLCWWACPYAQRAWMAFEEKKVPYKYVETNPYEKSSHLMQINPNGQVPAIDHAGKHIYGSLICVEYIDEAFPNEVHLLPKDPYTRAIARIWADFANTKLAPLFTSLVKCQETIEQRKLKNELLGTLKIFNEGLQKYGGESPKEGEAFFFGKHFTIVDIVFATFVQRFGVLKHFREFVVPETDIFERFHKWWASVQHRESFKATFHSTQQLIPVSQYSAEGIALNKENTKNLRPT
jgi:glutathione S-transferase